MGNRRRWPVAGLLLLLLCGWARSVAAQQAPTGNQYAVVIGVSRYKNLPNKQWLQYANADARLFADFLKSNRVGLLPENIRLLLDEDATTTNIKSAIGSWLLDRASANDTVYIFFAGHGYVDRRNDGYLISYDSNPEELYATAYSMRDLAQIVNDRLRVRNLVMFTDACKSGYIGADTGTRALENNKINEAMTRSLVHDQPSDAPVGGNPDLKDSRFILNSAGGFELSLEGEKWGGGHGVFTYNLVEGLKGAADRNSDSRVTANEILDYVRAQVRLDTQDRQNPVGSGLYSGDLILSTTGPGGAAPARVTPVTLADNTRPSVPAAAAPVSAPAPAAAAAAPSRGSSAGTLIVESPMIEVELEIDQALRGMVRPGEQRMFPLAQGVHTLQAAANGFVQDVREFPITAGEQIVVSLNMRPIPDLEPSAFSPETAEKELDDARILAEQNAAKALDQIAKVMNGLLELQGRRQLTPTERQIRDTALIEYIETSTGLKTLTDAEKKLGSFLESRPVLFAPPEWATPEEAPPILDHTMGQLRVRSNVAEASIHVDNQYLGSDAERRAFLLVPGEHTVRVTKEGFLPREESVFLGPGQREERSVPLTLKEIQFVMLSNMANVQSFLGNEPKGENSSLDSIEIQMTPHRRSVLRRLLDQAQVTGQNPLLSVVSIDGDRTGPVQLRLAKEDFQPREIALNLTDQVLDEIRQNDGFYLYNKGEIITLEPNEGTLTVESTIPGASVFLDGQKVGTTPYNANLGVGQYQLLVRHDVGKFATTVEVKPKEETSVQAELKPSVAFLGINSPEVTEDRYSGTVRRLGERLQGTVKSYLVETPNPSQYEFWKDFVTLAAGGSDSEEDKRKILTHLQQMKERYAADLILFGYFPTLKDYLAGNIQMYLFGPPNPKPDLRVVEFNSDASISSYANGLDANSVNSKSLFQGWIGLRTVDTRLAGHELVVLQVLPFSPAETAGLEPGTRIVSADGQPTNSLKLHELVQSKAVGESITLQTIGANDAPGTISLKIEPIPAFLPLQNQGVPLNSLITKMRLVMMSVSPESLEYNLALLNIALSHMQYNNWKEALDFLTKITLPEVQVAMVPAGVVEYLKGLCFESLGDKDLAVQAYRRASALKGSLMGSEYSEEARELANWRLNTLQ